MVAFQSAGKALACASAIQKALVERNKSAKEPVLVPMGLHAGEVVKEGEDFFGRNVIMAARVASQAQGGEILASGLVLHDGYPNDGEKEEKLCAELRGKVEVIGVLLDPDEGTRNAMTEIFGQDRLVACKSKELPKKLAAMLRSVRGV